MTSRRGVLLAATLGGACILSVASATIYFPAAVFTIDSTEVLLDSVAPNPPAFRVERISRGTGPIQRADGTFSTIAGDELGGIALRTLATDNRTPPERMGIRLRFVSGVLPQGLRLPDTTLAGDHGPREDKPLGRILLKWGERDCKRPVPFDFRLTAVAVDRAGNQSVPGDTIRVAHDGKRQLSN